MFYNESGNLIYASGEGNKNIIYTISNENMNALTEKIDAYKNHWAYKHAYIGGAYSDPKYFQNLASTYSNTSYNAFIINGSVIGSINAPWYMYGALAISISSEGFAAGFVSGHAYNTYGKNGLEGLGSNYGTSLNYGVANYWRDYFAGKAFDPWW